MHGLVLGPKGEDHIAYAFLSIFFIARIFQLIIMLLLD